MSSADLAAALAEGVALLRKIHADPVRQDEQLAAYRGRHAPFHPVLLTDQPPGSHRVERDLHFQHVELGGISLSWREQDGSPWALLYADHWAAQYVFSVNNAPVTIRGALAALRFIAGRAPDVLSQLIECELIDAAVRELAPQVSHEEIQSEVDRRRRALGLHEADRLKAWLSEVGMNEEAFIEAAAHDVQRRKWAEQLTADKLGARFAAAPSEFDRVTLIDVIARSPEAAERIREAVSNDAPWAVVDRFLSDIAHAELRRCFACEAAASTARDPCRVLLIVGHKPAHLDEHTASAIRERLVAEWVEEQRRSARIEWFWP
jgi:hypothetical protein